MRRGILVLMLVFSTVAAAEAQTEKRLSLGGGIGYHNYADSRFETSNLGFAPMYRLNRGRSGNGWGWDLKAGFSFSGKDVPVAIAGNEVQLGRLHAVPVRVGIARAYRQGPMKVSGWVSGGPSFNSFELDPEAVAAETAIGNDLDAVHVKTSFAYGPGVSASYDLSSWLGLQGSFGYTFHRPEVRTEINGVSTSERWNLDHSSAALGLVLGIL